MENIKNYEPKINFKFKNETEISVNSTLEEILINMNTVNVVDCLKLLKEIYFISYKGMGKIFGCSGSAIRQAISWVTFDGVLKESKVQEGILNLQYYYLRDTFEEYVEIEGEEEVGAGCNV